MNAKGLCPALVVLMVVGCLVNVAAAGAGPGAPLPLTPVREVPLPGTSSRFDYQSIDAAGRRLYVAHLGDSTVDVIDLDALEPLASIPDIEDVHGVLAVPALHRVFATATGSNEVVAIDTTSNTVVGRAPTGSFPDGLAYDSDRGLLLVSDKDDGSVTALDAASLRTKRRVRLGTETGNVAYDPTRQVGWAAVSAPDQLVAFDTTTGRVLTRVRLHHCRGAHGLYLAPGDGHAFVACERDAHLATVDLTAHTQTALDDTGRNPDVLAYDPRLQVLYVAAESGTVSVFGLESGQLHPLGQGALAPGAHTVAVDPVTHRVFFPLPNSGTAPVLRVMQPSGDAVLPPASPA